MFQFGALILGIFLGAAGLGFWWRGLAASVVASAAITGLATAFRASDPFVRSAPDFSITLHSVAWGFALTLISTLAAYALGAGGRWMVKRRR